MSRDPIHGTASAYFNGCRCPECREAGRLYRLEGTHEAYLAGRTRVPPLFIEGDRTTAFDPDDQRHGSISAYSRGCRCHLCFEAGRAYRSFRRLNEQLPKGWNARNPEGTE